MRVFAYAWVLAAALAAAPAVRAEEPPPPRRAVGGLHLRFREPLPPRVNLSRLRGLVGTFLGGEERERAVAEEEMVKTGPLVAIVLQERLDQEKAPAVRGRLEGLLRRLLADDEATACVIRDYAQALATVDEESGPGDWNDPGLPRLRAMAKVFHHCYVDPEHYGLTLDLKLHLFEPHWDLPAAANLYRTAGAMYGRLAETCTDPAAAARLAAGAKECRVAGESTTVRARAAR